MSAIEYFFRDLDALWKWPAEEKTSLRIIGSTALMLQADYERGTKDSELKRFNANNISDIEAMISRELMPHEMLIERFNLAVNRAAYDARAEDLPKYVENLHQVERDMLTVPESDIELPSWF